MAKEAPEVKTKVKTGECPWCNFENKDERVADIHEAVPDSKLLPSIDNSYQCNTCGKHWDKTALGKPWSLALERGPAWERENRARELRG